MTRVSSVPASCRGLIARNVGKGYNTAMFIVGVFCGLASQMNQYAFMLTLKKLYPGVQVKMAVGGDWLKKLEHNGYELDSAFGIPPERASKAEINRLANFYPGSGPVARLRTVAKFFLLRYGLKKSRQVTLADPTAPYPDLYRLNPAEDVLFWSNYDTSIYHLVEAELRQAFSFAKLPKPPDVRRLAEEIAADESSVAVHVRRGDYITYGYDVLGEDYYRTAFDEMEARVSSPRYYVFSDDPKAARELMAHVRPNADCRFMEGHFGGSGCYDMWLMSLCRNNVIANSGFSYWGAWLNDHPDKVVIGPRKHVSWCKHPVSWDGWLQV